MAADLKHKAMKMLSGVFLTFVEKVEVKLKITALLAPLQELTRLIFGLHRHLVHSKAVSRRGISRFDDLLEDSWNWRVRTVP